MICWTRSDFSGNFPPKLWWTLWYWLSIAIILDFTYYRAWRCFPQPTNLVLMSLFLYYGRVRSSRGNPESQRWYMMMRNECYENSMGKAVPTALFVKSWPRQFFFLSMTISSLTWRHVEFLRKPFKSWIRSHSPFCFSLSSLSTRERELSSLGEQRGPVFSMTLKASARCNKSYLLALTQSCPF